MLFTGVVGPLQPREARRGLGSRSTPFANWFLAKALARASRQGSLTKFHGPYARVRRNGGKTRER